MDLRGDVVTNGPLNLGVMPRSQVALCTIPNGVQTVVRHVSTTTLVNPVITTPVTDHVSPSDPVPTRSCPVPRPLPRNRC